MTRRTPMVLASLMALSMGLAGCPGSIPMPAVPTATRPVTTQPAATTPVAPPPAVAAEPAVTPTLAQTGAANLKANEAQKAAANDVITAFAEIDEFEGAGDLEEAGLTIQSFTTAQASDATASPSPSPSAAASAAASPSPSPSASATPSAATASAAPSAAPSAQPSGSPKPAVGKTKARTVVDNGDGTTTVTQTRTRRGKGGASGTETLKRTFKKGPPREPQAFEHTREFNGPNGYKRTMSQTRTRTADNRWNTTLKISETLANGKTRTVEVTGTYDAATKTYTQTGTITRFDGSTVTFTRTKSPTGRTAEATDTRNSVKVKASGTPTGATSATVTADGQEAGTVTATADAGTETDT